MKKITEFYKKNTDNLFIHISVPGILASIVFIARKSDEIYALAIGITAILLISLHTYLSTIASRSKLKEAEFWEKELDGHKWLLSSIREMIIRKLQRFKNHQYTFDEKEYTSAVMKNLAMLRQFYSHHANDPGNEFRVVFFKIGEDKNHLESQFYATFNGEPPSSHRDTMRQKEIFNRSKSQALSVKVWKNLQTEILERESEFTYFYPQQKDKIQSMICLPVCSGDTSEENLIGILVISSNKEYFKKAELKRHKEYIDQFILRIVFEYHKWEAFLKRKTK